MEVVPARERHEDKLMFSLTAILGREYDAAIRRACSSRDQLPDGILLDLTFLPHLSW